MNRWVERLRGVGPGALVAAAFLGPGTVTTCIRAGSGFGFALLWAVLLSTAAAVVLQEMAARLGSVTGRDLAVQLRERARVPWLRATVVVLVIGAVGSGCIAYEGGNITGGAIGLQILFGVGETRSVLVVSALAAYLLLRGGYAFLEKVLVSLVAAMGLAFLATAILVGAPALEVLRGAFVPSLPAGSTAMILALLGTTVVPYNLYLHSRAVTLHEEPGPERLARARLDLLLCIPLGGLFSMAIVVSAAVAFAHAPGSAVHARDLVLPLEQMLGGAAGALFGFGLFAAGLTSALTAPIALSYAVCGILGRAEDARGRTGAAIRLAVVAAGLAFAFLDVEPTELIVAAQALNGVLLPVSALFLLYVMNDRALGRHRNRVVMNVLGAAVVALSLFLSTRNLLQKVILDLLGRG